MATTSKVMEWFSSKRGIVLLEIISVGLLLVLGWGACWSLLGQQCLPNSNLFGIIIVTVTAKLFGSLVGLIHIPPLIGMIAVGIFFRNVPYIDIAKHIDPEWSSVLRTGAFVVLLLRAGLGLKLDILKRNKIMITCLSVLPCVVEVVVIACTSKPLLNLPWNWAVLLGFVIAGVSPAVVIPSMLSLVSRGYGKRVGVPTFVMAAATADNAFTITGFSVVLTFVFPAADSSLAMIILQGPLEVLIGGLCGVVLGLILSVIPPKSEHQLGMRTVLLCTVGLVCVFGLKRVGFSGAGVLAALIMATVAAQRWAVEDKVKIATALQFLWWIGEALLFSLVGAQIDFSFITGKLVGYGIVCLIAGLVIRCTAAFLSVQWSQLNIKEKLFVCASWTPKATVQAAIGSIALDKVNSDDPDNAMAKSYGEAVLCIAVLAIIVTSPPGAALITFLGPRLLDHGLEDHESTSEQEALPIKAEKSADVGDNLTINETNKI